MEITKIAIENITPYKQNAKLHTDEQVQHIINSIERFGFCDPIGVWGEKNIIVEGEGRYRAQKKLGATEIECIRLDHLTEEERKAYALTHNQITLETGWDFNLLDAEIGEILNFDMGLFGFDLTKDYDRKKAAHGVLSERFIYPPFSVLDSRGGNWIKRKQAWGDLFYSGNGRGENLIGNGALGQLAKKAGANLTGTSIFDPVLCEILINWYSKKGARIIDPFAGGCVRGIVSALLGREYHGNDLSETQISANVAEYKSLKFDNDFFDEPIMAPTWYCGDSCDIDTIINGEGFDLLLTCPPYGDLEKYSDRQEDISNMSYDDFLTAYNIILTKTIQRLNKNAFIAIVVGEIRDKKGHYRNFIGDTVDIVTGTGAKYYSELILVNNLPTAALRAPRQFVASRKVVNTHQKALIFLSGASDAELVEYLTDFDKNKMVAPLKESILVFLRGEAPNAHEEIEKYGFNVI